VVHVKQANGVIGDDSSQSAFALYQRQVAQVLAVKVQKVKGTEERRTASRANAMTFAEAASQKYET